MVSLKEQATFKAEFLILGENPGEKSAPKSEIKKTLKYMNAKLMLVYELN